MSQDRRWQLHIADRTRTLTEEALRAQLRAGQLSGLEAVRPEGEQVWAPLHALPLFAEEVPVAGDPLRASHRRAVQRWGSHLAVFLGVCGTLTVGAGHFPVCGLYWLVPLGLHTLRTLPSVLALLSEPAPTPPAEADAFARARVARPERRASLDRAEREASELSRLIASLSWYSGPDQIAALEAEDRELSQRLGAAEDPRLQEALEEQRTALRARIALCEEAALTLERLQAERETLRHQVEALGAGWLLEQAPPGGVRDGSPEGALKD